jgi:hypothetical protein
MKTQKHVLTIDDYTCTIEAGEAYHGGSAELGIKAGKGAIFDIEEEGPKPKESWKRKLIKEWHKHVEELYFGQAKGKHQ